MSDQQALDQKVHDQKGVLYIVSTPLGHLGDITARALEVLSCVDLIAAEDTRHTGSLLRHFAIQTPCISCHEHNEMQRLEYLLECLSQGQSVALVSDAGTPLISDPGYKVVRALVQAGFTVVPIPGPCAITTALVASGLPSDRFFFYGFPPAKSAARLQWLEAVAQPGTAIFYESKHRIMQSLTDMVRVFGGHVQACVGRELTKEYESFYRGSLVEVQQSLAALPRLLGEFVVMVSLVCKAAKPLALQQSQVSMSVEELLQLLHQPPTKKQLAARLAQLSTVGKQEWYRVLVDHTPE